MFQLSLTHDSRIRLLSTGWIETLIFFLTQDNDVDGILLDDDDIHENYDLGNVDDVSDDDLNETHPNIDILFGRRLKEVETKAVSKLFAPLIWYHLLMSLSPIL